MPEGTFKRPRPPIIFSEAEYLKLYRDAPAHALGVDGSTSYLWSPTAAERISELVGNQAKIIIILRDPVERAYSNYLGDYRDGVESRTFRDAIGEELVHPKRMWGSQSVYLSSSLYFESVLRFRNAFGADNVKIFFYEEMVSNTIDLKNELSAFLGIDAQLWSDEPLPHENNFGVPRSKFSRWLLSQGHLRQVSRLVVPDTLRNRIRLSLILFDRTKRMPLEKDMDAQLIDYFRNDVIDLSTIATPPWLKKYASCDEMKHNI